MENKLLEKEEIRSEKENDNDDIGSQESVENPAEEANEPAEEIGEEANENTEAFIDEIEGTQKEGSVEEMTEEAAEVDAGDHAEEDIKGSGENHAEEIEIAPVEEIEFVVEPKKKKRLMVSDFDESEEESDGESFFKTIRWKRMWDKISLALLLLLIAVPVGLLVYIVMTFFL